MYDHFMQTGEVKNFTGIGTVPVKFAEEHFNEAPLRVMTFAQTFGNMHYDCRQSKLKTVNSFLNYTH